MTTPLPTISDAAISASQLRQHAAALIRIAEALEASEPRPARRKGKPVDIYAAFGVEKTKTTRRKAR